MSSTLRRIIAAATGLLVVAVEVSPDQAISNLSAWAEKNGLPGIGRAARGPAIDWVASNVLWIGLGLALLLLWPDIIKVLRIIVHPRGSEKKDLIGRARLVTSEIAKSEEGSERFGDSIEKSEVYYAFFPYLSDEFKVAMNKRGRTVYAKASQGSLYPLARLFLNEIDRLEKEWRLR